MGRVTSISRGWVLNLEKLYGSQNVNIRPEIDSFLNYKKLFKIFSFVFGFSSSYF